MSENLLATVLELARLGAVGIGAIIALLAFFILYRSDTVDERKAALINRYMVFGFAFAVVAGGLGLVPLFVQSGGPIPVRLAFSPDFETQGLSPPKIELPDGTTVQPGRKFVLEPSLTAQVVTVGVDKTLEEVKSLRQTAARLVATNETVQGQRDALAAKIAPNPAAATNLSATSAEAKRIQDALTQSIAMGDYSRAATFSTRLNNNVERAERPVNVILTGQ